MTAPAKNNALAFVGQIMTAYKAVMKAEGQALKYAIECGEALNRAKENVESTKPKGKWNVWLKENCSEIQPRTERLYRQLATAVAEKPDIFAGCESIRSAVAKLHEPDDEEESDDNPEEADSSSDDVDEEESGNALPHPSFATEDLTEMLENCAVDEIGKALEDADKLDEVAARSIVRLTPDKVCVALTKAWPADQVRDLIKQLSAFVATLPTQAPSVRRVLEQPRLS
jgi:hypothetical protein